MTTTELFEQCSIPKAYFTLAIPCVLAKVVMLVYNLADTWFVSCTGNTSLVAGVSLGAPILLLMVALGDVFGQGGASLITRLLGMQKHERVQSLSSFCFWCAIGCGAVLTVVLLVLQTPILYLIGADDSTFAYALDYYRWIALCGPLVTLNIVAVNVLRTEGLATQSMKGSILGSIVNLLLDPVLILGLKLGAAGAAIATVIGYVCASAYLVRVYLRHSALLSIAPRKAGIDGKTLKSVFAIGVPASLNNVMQSLGIAMANRYLLLYGSDKIAAMGIALKVNMVVLMILVGFAFGPLPLVGYNYGAGNFPRLKKIMRFMYGFSAALTVGMAGILALLAPRLIALFLQDAAVIASGTLMLRALMLGSLFAGFALVTTCIFQATGNAIGALLLSINRQGLLYFALLALLSSTVGYVGVVFAQPVCDILCAGLGSVVLLRLLRRLK